MKEKYLLLLSILAIIFALFASGCIAPPQENSTFNPLGSKNQSKNTTVTATQNSFVSEVTLENTVSGTPAPAGFSTFAEQTKIPQDITCRIYEKRMFGNNASAFVFNLRDPPMYINFTVIPKNVTKTFTFTDSVGTYAKTTLVGVPVKGKGSTRTEIRSVYSDDSWFEVTVRSNKTKEIYLQDGFGEYKGYSTYLSRTLKVLKTDDLLVELRGNNIQAAASVWVKPIGNFEESRISEFSICTYWDEHRDTLATAKPTTLSGVQYTWTPENKVTKAVATMVKQGTQPIRNESNY
jgi:hypothetical protein